MHIILTMSKHRPYPDTKCWGYFWCNYRWASPIAVTPTSFQDFIFYIGYE